MKKIDIDNIVCRMSKSQWTLKEAEYWYKRYAELGFEMPSLSEFYGLVLNRFDSFEEEMDTFFLKNNR